MNAGEVRLLNGNNDALGLDWQLWCRLCAKDDSRNINVFFKDEEIAISGNQKSTLDTVSLINKLSLATVLKKYFNINLEDQLPRMLCTECFSLVTTLVNFIARVEKVQIMYNELKQSAVWNSCQLRAKYGITITPKMEHLENALQTDEVDICEYEYDDKEMLDPFGGDNPDIIRNIDEEENMNLATLRIALNTKCKSSTDQLPRLRRRSRKPKENLENKLSSEDLEKFEGKSFIYECSECPKQFKRIENYRIHMKKKHNSTPSIPQVTCNQCSRAFNTQNQLERHSKKHLPLELKQVNPCPYCDKKFITKSNVAMHIKFVHLNERAFICEVCGTAIHTRSLLEEHILTHTDYAAFECDVCHKEFKNKTRLKRHKQIHDQKKHICVECGLQLNSRTTLKRHSLVHSDTMQHKCDYCGRAFKRAKALKSHLILHTGLKPYSCDFCDLTFANGSNCRTHKKKAHPKELAELEASGCRAYTKNIPRIEALRAVTKAADNLAPVVSKQSGNFAFGKKPKLSPSDAGTIRTKGLKQLEGGSKTLVELSSDLSYLNHLNLQNLQSTEVAAQPIVSGRNVNKFSNDIGGNSSDDIKNIAAIDNLYCNFATHVNSVQDTGENDT